MAVPIYHLKGSWRGPELHVERSCLPTSGKVTTEAAGTVAATTQYIDLLTRHEASRQKAKVVPLTFLLSGPQVLPTFMVSLLTR